MSSYISWKDWLEGRVPLTPLESAAVSVQLAIDGEFFEEPFQSTVERDCYAYRQQYHSVFRAAAWVVIILEVFRKPNWTFRYHDWNDSERFKVSNLGYINDDIILGIQALVMVVLGISLVLDAIVEIFRYEYSGEKNVSLDSDEVSSGIHLSQVGPALDGDGVSSRDTLSAHRFGQHTIKEENEDEENNDDEGENISNSKVNSTATAGRKVYRDRKKWYWKSGRTRTFRRYVFHILLVLYGLKWCELLLHFLFVSVNAAGDDAARFVRSSVWLNIFPLECVYALLLEKRYFSMLKIAVRTIPRFLYLILLLGGLLVVYTALAMMLINPKSDTGAKYFESYAEGLWTMFTVMNAAAWPDPFVWSYEESKLLFFFFFAFLLVASWGMLNVISGLLLGFFRAMQRNSRISCHTRTLMNITNAYEKMLSMNPDTCPSMQRDSAIPVLHFKDLLREITCKFSRIRGIRPPESGLEARDSEFNEDTDILLAVMNIHYRAAQLETLRVQRDYRPTQASSADSAPSKVKSKPMEDTQEHMRQQDEDPWSKAKILKKFRPNFDWFEEYTSPLPLLDIQPLLRLHGEAMATSYSYAFGIRSSVSTLRKTAVHRRSDAVKNIYDSGMPRELFFQLFLTVVLETDCAKFLKSLPVLSCSKPIDMELNASPEMRSIYDRGSVLESICEDVADVSFSGDNRGISEGVFDVNTYHNENVQDLLSFSHDHPMLLPSVIPGRGSVVLSNSPDVSMPQVAQDSNDIVIFFDNDIRLQWLASRYEYLLKSKPRLDSVQSGLGQLAMPAFASVQWLSAQINCKEFEFSHDFIVTCLCFAAVCGACDFALAVVITVFCVLETILRMWAKGIRRYDVMFFAAPFHTVGVRFLASYRYFQDMALTTVMAGVVLVDFSRTTFIYAAAVRVILFPRNIFLLDSMRPYRRALKFGIRRCVVGALDVILLLLLLLTIGLVFAGVGVKAFGGFIQASGNGTYTTLSETSFGEKNYYVLNFNDILSAMGTLFTLLMVNNMDITSEGIESVTNGTSSRLYFVMWYVIGVLLLLNLFTASLLNGFMVFWLSRSCGTKACIKEDSVGRDEISTTASDYVVPESSSESLVEGEVVDISKAARPPPTTEEEPLSTHQSFYCDDVYQWMNAPQLEAADISRAMYTAKLLDEVPQSEDSGSDITISGVESTPERLADSKDNRASSGRSSVIVPVTFESGGGLDIYRSTFTQPLRPSERLIDRKSTKLLQREISFQDDNSNHNTHATTISQLSMSATDIPAFDIPPAARNTETSSVLPRLLQSLWEQKRESVSVVEYAAALMQCAKNGQERINFHSRFNYLCYRESKKYSRVFRLATWLLCVLPFVTRPYWTYHSGASSDWNDGALYPNSNIPRLDRSLASVITIILTCVITWGLILEFGYKSYEEKLIRSNRTLSTSLSSSKSPVVDEAVGGVDRCDSLKHASDTKKGTQSKYGIQEKRSSESKAAEKTDVSRIGTQPQPHASGIQRSDPTLIEIISQWFQSVALPLMISFNMAVILLQVLSLSMGGNTNIDWFCVWATQWTALLYMLWFNVIYMNGLFVLIKTLPLFFIMILSLLILVLIGGTIGRVIFKDDATTPDSNEQYFGSLGESIWTMFVAITSSSFPDQLIPGYNDRRWTMIYFFVVITCGSFLYLKAILVVVFAAFESGRQSVEFDSTAFRVKNLTLAYQSLDVHRVGYLTYKQVNEVLEELYEHYSSFRKHVPSNRERALLLRALDINGDGRVYFEEFLMILDLLRVTVIQEVEGHYLNAVIPLVVRHKSFLLLYKLFLSKFYRIVFDLSVLTLICTGIILRGVRKNFFDHKGESHIFAVVGILLVVDVILKLGIVGPRRVWSFSWHRLDILVAVVLVLFGGCAHVATSQHVSFFVGAHRILLWFRGCFFLRNVGYLFPALDVHFMFASIRTALLSVVNIAVPFFVIMFAFAALGMSLFGGLINKDPNEDQYNKLLGTEFGDRDFFELNFNDMGNSFVILVVCLHVSGWDVITGGLSAVTSRSTARPFFITWYCVGVLLMMNVITSFFITAFIVKLGKEQSEDDDNKTNKVSTGGPSVVRRNILTINTSCLEEALIKYDQESWDSRPSERRPETTAIKAGTDLPSERSLSVLSVRYTLAMSRMSGIEDLLVATKSQPKTRFVVKYNKIQNLSTEDLDRIMTRMRFQ